MPDGVRETFYLLKSVPSVWRGVFSIRYQKLPQERRDAYNIPLYKVRNKGFEDINN